MSIFLDNHIELPTHNLGLLVVPKVAASSMRRSVEASDIPYRVGLASLHKDYHRVAVVRNTYDRLLSCWAQKCSPHFPDKAEQLRNHRFYTGMAFSEFLDVVARNPRANHHFYPQDEIVGEYDEVWFLPELDARWRSRIPDIELLHLNKNPHRSNGWTAHYTAEDAQLVAGLYENEIIRWGFDL